MTKLLDRKIASTVAPKNKINGKTIKRARRYCALSRAATPTAL